MAMVIRLSLSYEAVKIERFVISRSCTGAAPKFHPVPSRTPIRNTVLSFFLSHAAPEKFTLKSSPYRVGFQSHDNEQLLVLLPDATTQELRRLENAKCFIGKPAASPDWLVCRMDDLDHHFRL
ncbi:hypothetical protein [Chloracidobacterium thermophilum]|uniref:hypothetical protein n=1 Tax=Chloracidobacterium thermophilum TaxID=458033 RepID=UPI0012FEE493|nr:hypothetical protein [Chloracidobacterium thermophilum]